MAKKKTKSSLEYWKDREEVQRQKNITEENVYNKAISEIHSKMYESIRREIYDFYVKYAKDESISLADAKKRVSKFDVEAFAEKAAMYVNSKDFSDKANQELRLYNLTMKINRLELLKSRIGIDMVGSYDELEKMFGDKLNDRILSEFERQAGILGRSVINPEKLAHSIVNASFHNATFSDRIWAHHDLLRSNLDSILRRALIQGLNPKSLTSKVMPLISDEVKKNKRASAETLLRTELCRVQTDAQMKSYERNGYDAYMNLAEPTACPQCKALDGKTFKLNEMAIGKKAPPMHPNCRCSTAAAVDDEEYERWFYKETGQHSSAFELGVWGNNN